MKTIKRALYVAMTLVITGCSSSITSLSQNSNYGHSNYKYFPYKSAIIKYESDGGENKRIRIWDNWGIQWWEEESNTWRENTTGHNAITTKTRIIRFKNNGTIFYVNYRHKKIRKSREANEDELLVANQDLSNYYVEYELVKEFFYNSDLQKSGKTEIVAGKKCNVWASEKIKLCMYEDLILLKSEAYIGGLKKWIIQQKAVSAQFDIAIDKSLFNLPNFPIEVDSRYISDNLMHTKIKKHMRGESELVQRIKFKGKRIRDQIKNGGYVRD